jgi:anti-anti-sigma factor
VKCYDVKKCSDQERAECYVWKNFGANPQEMEGIQCWVFKGAFDENGSQSQACRKCKYYQALNGEVNVDADQASDLAVVGCSGQVNDEKSASLAKVWDTLKKHNRYKVILDFSRVTTIYSIGLSMLVKINREAVTGGGMMVIVVGQGPVYQILQTTKLAKVLPITADMTAARNLFDAAAKRKQATAAAEKAQRDAEAAQKAAADAEARRAAMPQPMPMPQPQAQAQPKKFVRCWEYWNGQNPKNATKCDDCYQKKNPKPQACWIVEGNVEGVTFYFVNEACVDCKYFEEFGRVSH